MDGYYSVTLLSVDYELVKCLSRFLLSLLFQTIKAAGDAGSLQAKRKNILQHVPFQIRRLLLLASLLILHHFHHYHRNYFRSYSFSPKAITFDISCWPEKISHQYAWDFLPSDLEPLHASLKVPQLAELTFLQFLAR